MEAVKKKNSQISTALFHINLFFPIFSRNDYELYAFWPEPGEGQRTEVVCLHKQYCVRPIIHERFVLLSFHIILVYRIAFTICADDDDDKITKKIKSGLCVCVCVWENRFESEIYFFFLNQSWRRFFFSIRSTTLYILPLSTTRRQKQRFELSAYFVVVAAIIII